MLFDFFFDPTDSIDWGCNSRSGHDTAVMEISDNCDFVNLTGNIEGGGYEEQFKDLKILRFFLFQFVEDSTDEAAWINLDTEVREKSSNQKISSYIVEDKNFCTNILH